MNLIKQHWQEQDFKELHEYEKSLKGSKKDCEWEQRIINTKLECFGRTSTKARVLANEIKKGNKLEFIDNIKIENHFDSIIIAHLLSTIKEFEIFEKAVINFAETIDNWASTDTIRFKGKNHKQLFELSKKLLKSKKPFVRRTGVNIYFELIHDENYAPEVFKLLNSLVNEKEYYVNMCAAWLLAETFAKHRNLTIEYFQSHQTNAFIINKGISKCRDSYRVNKEDKELLQSLRMR